MASSKFPFNGSIKMLTDGILYSEAEPISDFYSENFRKLIKDLMTKYPKNRPSIREVYTRKFVAEAVISFLPELIELNQLAKPIIDNLKSIS
jgi:serine/threonine protein kinase